MARFLNKLRRPSKNDFMVESKRLFAESSGTTQKIIFASFNQAVNVFCLVDIDIAFPQ